MVNELQAHMDMDDEDDDMVEDVNQYDSQQINMDRQGEQQIIDDELGEDMEGEEMEEEMDDDQQRELMRHQMQQQNESPQYD